VGDVGKVREEGGREKKARQDKVKLTTSRVDRWED
jgi:hypothetical protein